MNSLNELSLLGPRNGTSSQVSPSWSVPLMSNEFNTPVCVFRCSECPLVKNSCEDLEIHIKIEHLNWLPFQCTLCSSKRASDNQMREHVLSHHRVSEYTYTYVDNPAAKRLLQNSIDRALSGAIQQMVNRRIQALQQKNGGVLPSTSSGNAEQKRKNLHDILSRTLSHENDGEDRNSSSSLSPAESNASATATVVSKNSANLNEHPEDLITNEQEIDFNTQLTNLFQNNTQDYDDDCSDNVSSSLLKTLGLSTTDKQEEDEVDPDKLIQNVSSLFNVNFDNFMNNQNNKKPALNIHGRVIKRRPGNSTQCVSKKRVLGECTKCQKPVTAGARQMHMFYHLGKDENTYRFKCKFDDCDVEHYRKDQMENHMSKQHGRIDHDMMLDRSNELYERVQKLSMELLGTVGNHPGPNAARAQAAYNKMQAEKEETRKRKANDDEDDKPNPLDLLSQVYSPATSERSTPKVVRPGNEENLECRLCHKFIVNRTRGFHILWHLCNDLGIIRYCCKLCDYKHERPQSVSTHGKKEHGTEDVVEDSLSKYEEEVKSMSKACFGLEQLFSKESRRRKIPKQSSEDKFDDLSDIAAPSGLSLFEGALTTSKKPNTTPTTTSSSTGKKRLSARRFGVRKGTKSKKQRQEMVKLREISMMIGGAAYFKKKSTESVICEDCGKQVVTRLSQHAYGHMENCPLYLCPLCEMGDPCRAMVIKHLKDFHDSTANPTDNRIKHAQDIKMTIKRCFPDIFVDAKVPTQADLDKLKTSLGLSDHDLTGDGEEPQQEEESEEEREEQEEEQDDVENQDEVKMEEEVFGEIEGPDLSKYEVGHEEEVEAV
ncbi:unnamed protein product [Bursaphelenchus okinawaensis]|uniref:C2H2-type domain-containing protein n=1 Tax=Bursaphelenchus okinawaensis TaxID=465554 RepID=A0A811L531_9BILA|nr:unnamed protein product [Bursaphelenchus okinawaensis]CAG9117632.1 unnamed protein product [Bursaphelenchus okinawaensis]